MPRTRAEYLHDYYLTVTKPKRQRSKKPPSRGLCAWCKKRDFLTKPTGRPRLYCSPACQVAASRWRTSQA